LNNNRQSADITLNMFGGLSTEVAPSDLPEGASPLNWDCDYDIGQVHTRGGLTNVYSFQDLAAGPNIAGDSGTILVNNVNWGNIPAPGYDAVQWLNGQSPIIWWNTFGFVLDPTSVTGIEVAITGHFEGAVSPECVLELTLTTDGRGVGIAKTFFFQGNDSTVTLGGPNDTWSSPIAVEHINQLTFGVQLYGISPGQTVSLFVLGITVKVYHAQGADNIDWVKTFIEDDQHVHTFVLDSAGTVWEEDVDANPGVLVPQLETIYPNQFAFSHTSSNEEWIAFSDLKKGTNIPRHGTNWDRISQVGPGAAPNCSGTSTGTNVWGIASISQQPEHGAATGEPFQDALWSQGPSSEAPGNTLTIFYRPGTVPPGPNPFIVVGQGIYLSGIGGDFTPDLSGTYIVTDAGFATPPGAGSNRWMFTVHTVLTSPQNAHVGHTAAGNYQPTLATLTLTKPATFQAGDQITIQGTGVGSWAGQWTILKAVNGGQYTITGTSLLNGVATYDFTLVNGALPSAGSFVTITGCVNGPFLTTGPSAGSSIFNVTQAPVESATTSSFTVRIPGYADVAAAVENGNAVEMGTVYQFDPGLSKAIEQAAAPSGTSVSAIFPALSGGTDNAPAGGGTVSLTGGLTEGVRQAVCIFETRNGYLTAPSPPVTFGITSNDSSIACQNIPIGPPNVVARIVAFTPSNGGNFFYIPRDVTIPNAGQPLNYSATRIADNVTTSKTFTFTDAVLMAAIGIDIPGNNLFNQIEIGSSMAIVPYAGRNCYLMQNNKVQNLINTTFDGGYNTPGQHHYPAGWTPTSTHNALGGEIRFSPIFGFSYYIVSDGSDPGGGYGAIFQGAYQDAYMVPILRPNTNYSVRIDIRSPSGITTQGGSLILDLVSYNQQGHIYGSANFPLTEMSTEFQTLTLPILVKGSLPLNVPTDLELRLYSDQLPAGADIEIDRFEIYPTDQPQLVTDVMTSYIGNLEAVDGVSGDLGVSIQNNQPVMGAFTQYDLLYFLKTSSMFSTQDSPSDEPADWKIREVSNVVGTAGIHAYDASSATGGGEEWMITACRKGLYIFSGTEPIKISQEIQNVWDAINWAFGHTIVVRNDTAQRRIMVQVPLATPNPWLPDAPLNANPTTPNVMLACSYKELQRASELAERGPVKLSFSGRLIAWDMSRKWSIWQIPSPYSDFVRRPDGNDAYFIGNGRQNSKVYMLDDNALNDDGIPINGLYTTYGMPAPEQAQQFGQMVGMYRKLYKYSSYNISGAGLLKLRALINNLNPAYPYTVPGGVQLTCPVDHNREVPFNLEGQRLYLEFSTNGNADNFGLSEVVLSVVKSAWSPVRGVN
jgi:hypothetical protein